MHAIATDLLRQRREPRHIDLMFTKCPILSFTSYWHPPCTHPLRALRLYVSHVLPLSTSRRTSFTNCLWTGTRHRLPPVFMDAEPSMEELQCYLNTFHIENLRL